ncbi:MAG: PHP domain-containing protein [Thermodesulfovibrionales bacterium]
MLRDYRADLHIHSCLSPCAELDMTPRKIIKTAIKRGLDIIALTDHNSIENVEVAMKLGDDKVHVLAGMEVTSSEEIHILALFDDIKKAEKMQSLVYDSLPSEENDERLYGHQVVVNEEDEVLSLNKRLLIGATGMGVEELVETIHIIGGISIASHVDKEAFSVISQLGFIPDDLSFDALEFSYHIKREEAVTRYKGLDRFPWISFSDAHFLQDIGKRVTVLQMDGTSLEHIKKALRDRRVSW